MRPICIFDNNRRPGLWRSILVQNGDFLEKFVTKEKQMDASVKSPASSSSFFFFLFVSEFIDFPLTVRLTWSPSHSLYPPDPTTPSRPPPPPFFCVVRVAIRWNESRSTPFTFKSGPPPPPSSCSVLLHFQNKRQQLTRRGERSLSLGLRFLRMRRNQSQYSDTTDRPATLRV